MKRAIIAASLGFVFAGFEASAQQTGAPAPFASSTSGTASSQQPPTPPVAPTIAPTTSAPAGDTPPPQTSVSSAASASAQQQPAIAPPVISAPMPPASGGSGQPVSAAPTPPAPAPVTELAPLPRLSEQQPQPTPVAPVAGPEPSAQEIGALRATYASLQERERAIAAQAGPASDQTRQRIAGETAALTALQEQAALQVWKAESLVYFRDALAAAPPAALPQMPPNLVADPTVAIVGANVTFYSGPAPEQAAPLFTSTQRTTVLRIAETGPVSLVWSQQSSFAFVVNQFIEVYQ